MLTKTPRPVESIYGTPQVHDEAMPAHFDTGEHVLPDLRHAGDVDLAMDLDDGPARLVTVADVKFRVHGLPNGDALGRSFGSCLPHVRSAYARTTGYDLTRQMAHVHDSVTERMTCQPLTSPKASG